jgi:hypothetical protein
MKYSPLPRLDETIKRVFSLFSLFTEWNWIARERQLG